MDEPLLTTEEVAKLLRVQPRTVDDWRLNGDGPDFVPISKNVVRYRPSAVDRFLAEKEQAAAAARQRRAGRRRSASAA